MTFFAAFPTGVYLNKEIIFYFISELVVIFMVKKSNICV